MTGVWDAVKREACGTPCRTEHLALISVKSDDVGRAFMFITVRVGRTVQAVVPGAGQIRRTEAAAVCHPALPKF